MTTEPAGTAREVIGLDIGGTAIKGGRFRSDGTCLAQHSVAIAHPATPDAVLPQLVSLVETLDPKNQAIAIGIGVPGPVDAPGRVALRSINLPGWTQVPLADQLEPRLQRPVVLANDANCAGLGEAWQGAGQGYRLAIMLTLGTGVGGAIIQDGRLFLGPYGAAGELGLITLYPEGPICNSGNRGSLEQYVSATAIRRRTGHSVRDLTQKARAGDPTALAHWQAIGHDLGLGLTSLIYVLTPEVVIIGGGVSHSAEFFLPVAIATLQKRVLPTSRQGLAIVPAALGNQAGCLGAAKLALDHIA